MFFITDRAAAGLSTCSARLCHARDEEVVKINSFNFKSEAFNKMELCKKKMAVCKTAISGPDF